MTPPTPYGVGFQSTGVDETSAKDYALVAGNVTVPPCWVVLAKRSNLLICGKARSLGL